MIWFWVNSFIQVNVVGTIGGAFKIWDIMVSYQNSQRERERERADEGPKSDLMMARRELTITRTDRPR